MTAVATITKETTSLADVLAELSFKVDKEPIQLLSGEKAPGCCVVRYDGKIKHPISWVGEDYGLVPHNQVLEPLLKHVGSEFDIKRCDIERFGRRVSVELLSKETFAVIKGDDIRMKMSFINSYDRTSSLKLMFGAFRLKCKNGMGSFLSGFVMNLREAHTKLIGDRVADPKFIEKLGGLTAKFKESVKVLTNLASKNVDDEQAKKFVEKFVGAKSVDEVLKLWTEGRGQNGDKTAWALYNGASQYLTDMEVKAKLPISAAYRTLKKTTQLLQALNDK